MDIKDIAVLISPVYDIAFFSIVLIAMILYKYGTAFSRKLVIYLALMGLVEVLSYILGYVLKMSNYILLPFYCFLELSFFLYLYRKFFLKHNFVVFKILGALGLLYIAGETLWFFVINKADLINFQPYCKVADNFVIICMTLSFLYYRMTEFNETKWDNFWINIVFLVYFTFDMIFFLPFSFIVSAGNNIKFIFWILHQVSLLLLYGYLLLRIIKDVRLVKRAKAKTGYIK